MKKRLWQLKQVADNPEELDMYIYDDIQGDTFDYWTWSMTESETSANYFREQLAKYPDVKQINLYVNSYGGSVYEAMAIRSQLLRHSAKVIAIVDGFACSAASFILTGCDEVKMYSNTMQMIHNMWDVVAGNANQLRKAADDLDKLMEGNRQAYLEKSGGKISEEELIELLDNETWLTAQECLDYGLADEVIAEEADLTEAKQLLQKANKTLEQQLSYSRALSAQIKQLSQKPKEAEPKPDPKPIPNDNNDPEPQENKTKNLFMALFVNKEED
ncbi:head maturation protease, ClpP-related [Orenia marismortui]|uniref:head maturation protease, ClpP-related n=1 Tax=Orenia marismortui TaxID=46469 RepID=UPI000366EA4B|nr:head maturation protease, ClpP-related [Orenia marismortui]